MTKGYDGDEELARRKFVAVVRMQIGGWDGSAGFCWLGAQALGEQRQTIEMNGDFCGRGVESSAQGTRQGKEAMGSSKYRRVQKKLRATRRIDSDSSKKRKEKSHLG